MLKTIITTVGTSLLTNTKRETGNNKPDRKDLINYMSVTEPEKACAETNSLSRIIKDNNRIIFFYSQTEEGRLCAEVLFIHYGGKGYETVLFEVPELTYKETAFKLKGLRSLVANLIEKIENERKDGREVAINATGGFKAEIAYATVVGLLFNVPVYYIHEIFSEVIKLPAVPIAWNYSLIADNEELLYWIADVQVATDVKGRLKKLPRDQQNEIQLLLNEEEGHIFLSPVGLAFLEAYKLRIEQAQSISLYFSPTAKKAYDTAEPGIKEVFNRYLKKIRLLELRRSGSAQVENCDCWIYPKGNRDGRIFYLEDNDTKIYICELARHEDKSYERLIKKGIKRKDYDFNSFT